jgi:hypothetical protein
MMSRDIFVFLGPTLSVREAYRFLPATYLAPVSQGDVFDVCSRTTPSALVIIDGVFDSVPAVRHKEILWAMARGVPVFGCSSMGALRAAELAPFGMVGFGFVYRWYRATPLADDDEVTVAIGPKELGSPAVSEALIDMRKTFKQASREGVISRKRAHALERISRQIYFPERTYEKVLSTAADPSDQGFVTWLANGGRRSVKADDARGLLTALASNDPRYGHRFPNAELERHLTLAWVRDLIDSGRDVWRNR